MRALVMVLCLLAGITAMAAERLQNIIDDGWANAQGYRFSGRLTESRKPAAEGSGSVATLYKNTRLLFANGEEGQVNWSVGPLHWLTRADGHGYWELQANQMPGLDAGWHTIETEQKSGEPARFLVHDPRNHFGLISDIDDTILVSQVLNKTRLLRNSLTLPPEARMPVAGMAALYLHLLQKNSNPQATPVFYVSASPRQLTDGIRRFLKHNGFPQGVLQLKEVGTRHSDPLTDQQTYKVKRITTIFKAFPDVRFALIGDDGERDPESFAELQTLFPHQISEIWIRRVHPDPGRLRYAGQEDLASLLAAETGTQ